nr:integrase, catalytic region, zinc finger, CCHC-type, peptidase aspartic, catalytic [Tanacetum cinerariifolium]
MLMKPRFSYDHTTRQALGFQNPFYLKKAQQLKPKLYDGNIIEKTNAIVIPDFKETLMLAEESRSKMLLKQKDPIMLEKKVNTRPVNYDNSSEPTLSSRPTKVEVPKELPKVSMVNMRLKKLKHHLASFDVVIKERTTTTTITEGSWGFEHTKACFRDEIIPFVKALKDLFNSFDQYLEIFQRDNSVSNQSALSFDQLFELNELKAQSQEKDTVIKKLKERIKSLSGNACPLTRFTTTAKVPLKEPTALESDTPKPMVVQIVLWYLDSSCSKHMTEDRSQLTNFVYKFLGIVKFENDHVAKILGYVDYQIGNVMISRVYYVKGLGPNLFFIGQFCDSNLEVAFPQHTCFIRNLDGVNLLIGSRGHNMYTLSLGDMMAVDYSALAVIAPIAEVVALEPAASTRSPSSTTVDQDAPSPSNSKTTPKTQYPLILNDVEEDNHDLDAAHMNNDLFFGISVLK